MPKKSMTGTKGAGKKFAAETPEAKVEKHHKVGHGVLTEKEALFNAANAPSGTYVQEYFDANGNIQKFIGALVPLYITPDILDFEFIEFVSTPNAGGSTNTHFLTELTSRGGPITVDDKIKVLGSTVRGRTILQKYAQPSDIFIRDGSATPMLVKDYYLVPDGLRNQARGIRDSVTTNDKIRGLSNSASVGGVRDIVRSMFGADGKLKPP